MTLISPRRAQTGGFTIVDGMFSVGMLMLLGMVFFQVLNSGIVLFAKNTAVNVAHQEARDGINRLVRDIHASISVPQLRDTNFNVVSSTPQTAAGQAAMAAGVSFQNVALGPQYVWKDPGNTKVMVKGAPGGKESPTAGMRLIAPLYNIEDDIVKVTASPTNANHHNVFLASTKEDLLATKTSLYGSTTNTYSIVYYTNRVMYLVRNGQYIPDSQGPFTITTTAASAADQERFALSSGSYMPSTTGSFAVTPSLYVSGTAQRYRYEGGELRLYIQDYTGSAVYWRQVAVVARHLSNPRPFYVPLVANASGPWYESTNSYGCYTTSSAQSTGARFASSTDTRYVGIKLTARDPKSSNRGYRSTATLLNTQVDYRSRIALYQ